MKDYQIWKANRLTEKVVDFFIVYLNELASYKDLKVVSLAFTLLSNHWCIDNIKNMIEHVRHNALIFSDVQVAHHRMRFTASSLSIRENSTVISLKRILNKLKRRWSIDFLLLRWRVEHLVKSKGLILTFMHLHSRRWVAFDSSKQRYLP